MLCTALVAGYLATPLQASLTDGCDITVSRLGMDGSGSGDDFGYYGASGSIRAFASASTSCNAGTDTCQWIDSHSGGSAGKHPTIWTGAFRLLTGPDGESVFEQIGMSWGKHSFCAVSEPTCGAMVNGSCIGTSCSTLGVGCADTYWAGLNAAQGDLGPRNQISAWPAFNTPSHTTYNTPSTAFPSQIRGRLQVNQNDVNAPAGWSQDEFIEVLYIGGGDEELENRHNNASWRSVNLNTTSISGRALNGEPATGPNSVRFLEYAIQAWREAGIGAGIKTVDVPGNGRFHIGWKHTELPSGDWHYSYFVYNANSDDEAVSFMVPASSDLTISGTDFRSPPYHSGDGVYPNNQANTDWEFSHTEGGQCRWDMMSEGSLSNHLGFATGHTYTFIADSAPTFGAIAIETEGGETLNLTIQVPGDPVIKVPCAGDTDGDGDVDVDDLNNIFLDWGTDGSANGGDVTGALPGSDPDGIVDINDLVAIITNWGACP